MVHEQDPETVPSALIKMVWSHRALERAWHVIEENARTSKSDEVRMEVATFKEDASKKIRSLSGKLSSGSFRFLPAKGIALPKPDKNGKVSRDRFRPIVLAQVESRIVQRSILDVLLEVPSLKPYIQTPYSFGGIRKKSEGDLAAVPAAIKAVLDCIGSGANFAICADISKFFTRIPKSAVTPIVAQAVRDEDFMKLFERAITVELSNLAELRERAEAFPIHDIGVAQGSSLSPLLGNILLHDFDREMNQGDCNCIRYIDDVIILAPNSKAAKVRLQRAEEFLEKYGMTFGVEKSRRQPVSVESSIEFLGIEMINGFIRPTSKAQDRLLASLQTTFGQSKKSFLARRIGQAVKKEDSLIATLRRVDGIVQGWGKHYRFCNDSAVLKYLDTRISDMIRAYLGLYADVARNLDGTPRRQMLGMEFLAEIERNPLEWPKRSNVKILAA